MENTITTTQLDEILTEVKTALYEWMDTHKEDIGEKAGMELLNGILFTLGHHPFQFDYSYNHEEAFDIFKTVLWEEKENRVNEERMKNHLKIMAEMNLEFRPEDNWATIYTHHSIMTNQTTTAGKQIFEEIQEAFELSHDNFNPNNSEAYQWGIEEARDHGPLWEHIHQKGLIDPYQLHYLLTKYLNKKWSELDILMIWNYLYLYEN